MSKSRCDTGISIYKMSECVSDIRNARDRAAAAGALARKVDEVGGVGVACDAGVAGPLRGPAGRLRVIRTLRSCLVREAQQEDQQEDQSIQTRAAARVTAHARGV
jgi:hypothetical protein